MIKTSQLKFFPTERSLFSTAKRICFLIGDLRPAPSLFYKHFLLPVVSHQDQFGFGAGSSGGVVSSRLSIRRGHVAAFLRGLVDGFGRGLGWGVQGSRHLWPLLLADGAERQPGKCLYGGAPLRGGAAQECPETPVELNTNMHSCRISCCNNSSCALKLTWQVIMEEEVS